MCPSVLYWNVAYWSDRLICFGPLTQIDFIPSGTHACLQTYFYFFPFLPRWHLIDSGKGSSLLCLVMINILVFPGPYHSQYACVNKWTLEMFSACCQTTQETPADIGHKSAVLFSVCTRILENTETLAPFPSCELRHWEGSLQHLPSVQQFLLLANPLGFCYSKILQNIMHEMEDKMVKDRSNTLPNE